MASNYGQDGQIPIPPRRTRSSASEKVTSDCPSPVGVLNSLGGGFFFCFLYYSRYPMLWMWRSKGAWCPPPWRGCRAESPAGRKRCLPSTACETVRTDRETTVCVCNAVHWLSLFEITDVDMSENVARMASHLKQLEKKRDELQRQCTAIETINRQSEVNRIIDKNKELKQDVYVLKNLTYR